MTAKGSHTSRPVDAVHEALDRELGRHDSTMKPIELVKIAISSYLSYIFTEDLADEAASRVESKDSAEFRRGTHASIDKLLFNANYWRSAYESRIIEACSRSEDALTCLQAISVWTSHALRLNTLSPDETVAVFERFCPPFASNNRRGSRGGKRKGKGPLPDLEQAISDIEAQSPQDSLDGLKAIVATMKDEAAAYEALDEEGTLNAFFAVLPAWCLQNRIELVRGSWWDDHDVMSAIIDALHAQFLELGFGEAICRYYLDSCYEALDAYHRDLTGEIEQYGSRSIPELINLVHDAREKYPSFETDGYGEELPGWLIAKEQLIWNVVVCALYGPASARPLLVDSPDLLAGQGYTAKTDVITELARTSFARYTADRIASQTDQEFVTFASLPTDLRDSSIAYISSIHSKLETLGYEVLPAGSCYPDRCVTSFTASEVECLAILEHRRWLRERQQAGWRFGESKNVEAQRSPYMVPWEELPDRAKEWNRSAVRSIPALLASVNLAVVR